MPCSSGSRPGSGRATPRSRARWRWRRRAWRCCTRAARRPAAPRLDALRAAVDEPGPVRRELLGGERAVGRVSNEQAAVAAGLAERASAPGPARPGAHRPALVPQSDITLLWCDRFAAARRGLDAGLVEARETGDGVLLAATLSYRSLLFLRTGDFAAAEADARAALGAAGLARRALPADGHDRARRVPARAGRPRRRGAGLAAMGEAVEGGTLFGPWCGTSAAGSRSRGDGRRRRSRPPRRGRRAQGLPGRDARHRALAVRGGARRAGPGPPLGRGAARRRGARAGARLRHAAGAGHRAARVGRRDGGPGRGAAPARGDRGADRAASPIARPRPRSSSAPGCAATTAARRPAACSSSGSTPRTGSGRTSPRTGRDRAARHGRQAAPGVLTGVDALTASELRVAELAAQGLTNREIAQALFVTSRTVEGHLTQVFRKLDVPSREALDGLLMTAAGG